MKLDRNTYEAWLLDRIEGTLTPAQERELAAFLAAHPELPIAPDVMPSFEADAVAFDRKALLKKTYPPEGSPDAARLNDFLVARLEGDLSTEQEQELDVFLYAHPAFAQDAKRMAAAKVGKAAVAFIAKDSVERHFPPKGIPDAHRLTDFLIAAQEGDLTDDQGIALDRYLRDHPEAWHERRLILAARVNAGRVVFDGKAALKKRDVRVVPLWSLTYRTLAAAASIALLLGLGWWLARQRSGNEIDLAHNEKVVPKKESTVVPSTEAVHATTPVPQKPRTQGRERQDEQGVKQKVVPAKLPASTKEIPARTPVEQAMPAREEPAPHVVPAPSPEPALANVPVAPHVIPEGDPMLAANAPSTAPSRSETVGTFVANKVRNVVLDEPQRATVLDGNDALAAADKALGAITGGQAGVQVQRTSTRERLQLRFGRNLSFSASRSR